MKNNFYVMDICLDFLCYVFGDFIIKAFMLARLCFFLALMCYGKGREYDPCISACPKTCHNYNEYEKIAEACEFACVEGCSCPEGTVRKIFELLADAT